MIRYKILETGVFYADGGAMFGAIPKRTWSKKYPSDTDNCCRLAMNCVLVWNESRVVLFDTGVGSKRLGNLSYYNFQEKKDLVGLIKEEGFKPEQVTDVILSHLHFDHCGGCTIDINMFETEVVFPKARHWVSKMQLNSFLSPNELEKDSYRLKDITPIMSAGLLRLIDSDFELFDGVQLKLFDGHSKGQIVSFINTENEVCVFPGDLIPTKAHLSNEWISAYDIEPLKALEAKKQFKKLLEGEKVKIIFYHDSYTPSHEIIL
jgi:Zn-dependent hydrolases, including glyoxylases